MSKTPNPFPSPESLTQWLQPRLPSDAFASWGATPGTKNVHNLWIELSNGEISLSDSTPPIRTLRVISLRILDHARTRVLLESHQQLSDGSTRLRNRPLSEKMKPDETPESAVYRAVREELGSVLGGSDCCGAVRIVPDSVRVTVEDRVSGSYPGLPCSYVLHSVDVWVDGLPEEGEFCSVEEEEKGIAGGAVTVEKHFWKWVSIDSVDF